MFSGLFKQELFELNESVDYSDPKNPFVVLEI